MISFLRKLFYRKIEKELAGCKTVLDIGCGYSSMLEHIPKTFESTGLDAYPKYIEAAKAKGIFDHYIVNDITKQDFPFKSFDAIISFGLVEHLEKKDSIHLLNNMDAWARKKVIIECPNGFHETREESKHGIEEEDHLQLHKCGWTPKELRREGYTVRGLNGLKWTRNWPRWINQFTYPLVYFFPSLSWELLAVKKIGH